VLQLDLARFVYKSDRNCGKRTNASGSSLHLHSTYKSVEQFFESEAEQDLAVRSNSVSRFGDLAICAFQRGWAEKNYWAVLDIDLGNALGSPS
jgi:hypothetical protein